MSLKIPYKYILLSPSAGSYKLGPNLRWYWLGTCLVKAGFDFTIYSGSYFHKFHDQPVIVDNLDGFVEKGVKYNFIKLFRYRQKSISQFINWFLFPLMIIINRKRIFDGEKDSKVILIVSSPPVFTVLLIPFVKRFYKNVTVVLDVRDLWPRVLDEIRGSSIPFLSWLMLKTEKIGVDYSDYIFSAKEGDFKYFSENYNFDKSNFLYVPNGRPLCQNNASISSMQLRDFPKSKFIIGYVGSFGYYYDLFKVKNIIEVMSAANLIEYFHFVFVGDGPIRSELYDCLSSISPSSFTFTGRVSKEMADQYIVQMDICYLPLKDMSVNQYGISCNKLYDYFSFGKPVIGHYLPNEFDPILSADAGLCIPTGFEADIVPFLNSVMSDPNVLSRMGNNGLSYLVKNNSRQIVAHKIVSFLDNKLNDNV